MKNINMILSTVLLSMVLSVGAVLAQDHKMDMPGMDMAKMHSDAHHTLMMAYHHNALAFTRALWSMTADGKIENVDMARVAFAEIKRSLEKMDEVHQMHMSKMGKMDAAMVEKMKPMMEKMAAEKAGMKGHVQSLENALQGSSPVAQDIEMHAAALLLRLEKPGMHNKKMAM